MYALYPFTVPSEMREVQKSLGHEAEFTYDRPKYVPPARVITDAKITLSIIRDSTSYTLPCIRSIQQLGSYGSSLAGTDPKAIKQRRVVRQAVLGPKNSTRDFAIYIQMTTSRLFRDGTCKLRDIFEVDIVKHVASLSWTQFVAHLFYIPLKDPQNPKASFDCRTLYDNMARIFQYVYHSEQTSRSKKLRIAAPEAYKALTSEIEDVCEALGCSSFAHVLLHRDRKTGQRNPMANHGDELLQRLFDSGKTIQEVVSLVVFLAVEIAVSGSFALAQIVDVFLSEPHYTSHWPRIQTLATDPSQPASDSLRAYVLEAFRLSPPAMPFLRVSDTFPSISDWRYAQAIKKGDTLLLDIAAASRDPLRFPDPDHIKLDRVQESYLPFFDGPYGSLVREIVVTGLVAQLRVLGSLKGLKRAPGPQEMLKKRTENGVVSYLSEARDEWVPSPTSLKVHFETPTPT